MQRGPSRGGQGPERARDRGPMKRTWIVVSAAGLGNLLFAAAPHAQPGGICQTAHYAVASTRVVISCPAAGPERRVAPGPPAAVDRAAETGPLGAASVSFGHDVRVGGNRLPAGDYEIRIHPDGDAFVRAAFHRRAARPPETDGEGLLQLAVRTIEAPPMRGTRFGVDRIDEEAATFYFRHGSRKATLRLETTGHVRRSTPPPALPVDAHEPWRVVQAALDAFVAEDVAAHVADFADDFETNFDDNAGLEAHTQQMHNLREAGRLEDIAVHLAEMESAVDGAAATFGNIVVFTNFRPLTFAFTLERRDGRWSITYLDTRRTRRLESAP